MSEKKPTLSQQIAAAWLGHDILAGRKSPSAKERAYAAPHAEAAARTLEWLRDNEEAIRDFLAWRRAALMAEAERPEHAEPTREYLAIALLRRVTIALPGGTLLDDVSAFIAEIDGGAG